MEEARYWMWTKRKNSLSSDVLAPSTNLSSSYGDSWEEQAFAEDAAGPLGGCIWPPRSYTCSFCKKEFRSAQALGGHMNVHRRDRARLKQLSPGSNNQILSPTSTSLGIQYPSKIHTLVYNQNSNHGFLGSPSSPSRVLLPISQVIGCHEKSALSSTPPFSSSIFFQEEQKRTSVLYPPLTCNLVADRYCSNISDVKEEKNLNFLETNYKTKRDCVAADSSVSLNFVACRNDHESITSSSDEDDNMSCKRRRTDDDATVSFFPQQSLIDRNIVQDPQLEAVEVSPTSKEDLDLELRLGDHRSVK